MGKKTGQLDNHFEGYLKDRFGAKATAKILASKSNTKRAYSMYLQGKLADFTPDEIPF